jgi:ribosomal protein L11 methyltransferase
MAQPSRGLVPGMTIRASLTAAFPEIRRIASFLERDYGEEGVVVSLDERPDGSWAAEAYFAAGEAEAIAERLHDRLGGDAFGAPLSVEALPETDWIGVGLKLLKPVAAGRFLVHGSHDRDALPRGSIAIEIDAGQAFGTGHHATTRGTLIVLDRLMRTRRFTRPLDLGTGAGVLAIAMAHVLKRPIVASDIDPVAVAVARENARRNGVGGSVRTVTAPGIDSPVIRAGAPFDLIAANILAEPLVRLAPRLAPLIATGGTLVLSGLLPHQRPRVVAAYGAQGIRLERAHVFDGWSVLVLRRA